MRLDPKRPPGRSTRKALTFASEIARLHADGYSCDAIRQALEEAGLTVSRSTVIREVSLSKKSGSPPLCLQPGTAVRVTRQPATPTAASVTPSSSPDGLTGKEIAAAFMKDRITGSFLRSRITNESSGH